MCNAYTLANTCAVASDTCNFLSLKMQITIRLIISVLSTTHNTLQTNFYVLWTLYNQPCTSIKTAQPGSGLMIFLCCLYPYKHKSPTRSNSSWHHWLECYRSALHHNPFIRNITVAVQHNPKCRVPLQHRILYAPRATEEGVTMSIDFPSTPSNIRFYAARRDWYVCAIAAAFNCLAQRGKFRAATRVQRSNPTWRQGKRRRVKRG